MISEKDQILIKKASRESLGLSDRSGHYVSRAVVENTDLFETYASNGEVADIGCSRSGPDQARYLLGVPSIKLVHLVDLFLDEERFDGFDPETMRFHKKDGLQFLLEQKDVGKRINVKTSSIDEAVIGVGEYLRRMGEVIHEIVPEDGFYIASVSETLQRSASRLFPIHLKFCFDTHLYLKKQPTGYLRLKIDAIQIDNEFVSADAFLNRSNKENWNYLFSDIYQNYKALVGANNPSLSDGEVSNYVTRTPLWINFNPQDLLSKVNKGIEELRALGNDKVAQFYLRGIERIRDSVERNIDNLQRAHTIYTTFWK